MLDCQLCWRRYLRALLTSQSACSPSILPSPRPTGPHLRRLLTTSTSRTSAAQPEPATQGGNHIRLGIIRLEDRLAYRQSQALQKAQLPTSRSPSSPSASSRLPSRSPSSSSASSRLPSRPPSSPSASSRLPNSRPVPKSKNFPQSRLTVSEDPAKLAAQTKRLLDVAASNPSTEARLVPLTYVRAATSAGKTDTTAAWNELISHALDTGDPMGAFKHYNDMKKRGVSPNNHTYTILISGLALPQNVKHATSLPRALATYRALKDRERDSKGGRGKAEWNLIHTNAILKVCSKAGAVEEMWQIVRELPEEGKNSADAKTYTSLINGLRQMRGPGGRPYWSNAEPELKHELGDRWDPRRLDIAECQRIEETVDDAERMWGGLLTRYTNGKLTIDEELICAMARMRLSSTRSRDWHKVFSMMEELYGIPNLLTGDGKGPPIGAGKARWSPPGAPMAQTATLGVLLAAAEHVQASPTVVKAYWDHFTQTLRVNPDVENYHGYLRALRRSREGQVAADLVEAMVKNAIESLDKLSNTKGPSSRRRNPGDRSQNKKFVPHSASEAYTGLPPIPILKTFTIALSCCKRLTTTGAATSTPKHCYMYANVVRILNAFDSLYKKFSSLPPIQPGTATSPDSYQSASQAILSQETACRVYTKFLETAHVLAGQDPQVAKQALKRATSPPEEEEVKRGKKPPSPKTAHAEPPALPPHLPTLLSSSRTPPPHATTLAETILRLAVDALKEPRATWGHGERDELVRNTEMLKVVLGKKSPGPNPFQEKITRKERSFASSSTAQPEAWNARYIRAKQRGAMGGDEGVENAEDSATAWQPDSARDREKKRMDAWGLRAKVGAIGEASRLKHHKLDFEEVKERARSDFRGERESGREGGGCNGSLRQERSEGERDRDRGDRNWRGSINESEGEYVGGLNENKAETGNKDTETESEDTETECEDTETECEDTETECEDTETESEDTETECEGTETESEDTETESKDTETEGQNENVMAGILTNRHAPLTVICLIPVGLVLAGPIPPLPQTHPHLPASKFPVTEAGTALPPTNGSTSTPHVVWLNITLPQHKQTLVQAKAQPKNP
ncbi:hypothetical protein L211DRAFT_849775 [Terfezia boudieri ATCC MYA-4762]|uniref:Pentacotripeptide-repeat region of PRORP domain-containing protein n=1 Tax=Terfezia boudieri ATCC MYA-4762 TaxID=1051890 RepID=A0A3N4LPD7_9PEZI|nr:hypothetical protein L211DRAFT_849775 [Terfezia boudieri ATCC MYA-4762]